MQQDSHEFLLLLLNWLLEDLSGGVTSGPPMNSKLDSLVQGVNQYNIMCSFCKYESISFEPFTIVSLSLPPSENCTLEDLLRDTYMTDYVHYRCPQCNTYAECTRRPKIEKLPSVLILHLKRFDNSSRKKENEIAFPLINLSLLNYVAQSASVSACFNLCGVTNHYGTLVAGHYTSLCRSLDGNTWYKCDDKNVKKTEMLCKSNAAYMLFYELSIADNAVP